MLLEAANDLDLNISASFMIGDKASDIEAGLNAGVQAAVWVTDSPTATLADRKEVWVAPDFKSAVEKILSEAEGASPPTPGFVRGAWGILSPRGVTDLLPRGLNRRRPAT